jgi:hypothetical protein
MEIRLGNEQSRATTAMEIKFRNEQEKLRNNENSLKIILVIYILTNVSPTTFQVFRVLLDLVKNFLSVLGT